MGFCVLAKRGKETFLSSPKAPAQITYQRGRQCRPLVTRPTTQVAKTVIEAGWKIRYLW